MAVARFFAREKHPVLGLPLLLNSRGGTPLYQVYGYMPPQRVWILSRFGLKTGIDFEHFGLKLGMVIGGTFTKAYKLFFFPATGTSNW